METETALVDQQPDGERACDDQIPSISAVSCEERVDAPTLQHNLASLFLCMQTVLHISRHATQTIIEKLNDIYHLSRLHAHQNVREVLSTHNLEVDDTVVQEVIEAVLRASPLYESTTKAKGTLATDYRRNSYYDGNFPVVQPVEYLFERVAKKSFVYVPVLQMLERLLCCQDVVRNIHFTGETLTGFIQSFRDGQYFQSNKLFGEQESIFVLALCIDDFEVCNPLGTSRRKKNTKSLQYNGYH